MGNALEVMRQISDLAKAIITPLYGKSTAALSVVLSRWADIVGEEMAAYTIPLKISTQNSRTGKAYVLSIAAPKARHMELQYQVPILEEKLRLSVGSLEKFQKKTAETLDMPPPRWSVKLQAMPEDYIICFKGNNKFTRGAIRESKQEYTERTTESDSLSEALAALSNALGKALKN